MNIDGNIDTMSMFYKGEHTPITNPCGVITEHGFPQLLHSERALLYNPQTAAYRETNRNREVCRKFKRS